MSVLNETNNKEFDIASSIEASIEQTDKFMTAGTKWLTNQLVDHDNPLYEGLLHMYVETCKESYRNHMTKFFNSL